ncbi:DMT family transporter [Ruegeria jejuensis]|uniref:DMT family transporter n=1 Tax=Ruegeria jejuensis TaxID=3233338 RepID=UPI00355B9E9E
MAAPVLSDRPTLGIVMMLTAYLLFSVVDTSVKWMLALGLPALQLAFLRYAGHFVISLSEAGLRGLGPIAPIRRHFGLLTLRAAALALATVGNFFVLTYLSLTLVSAIMFSAPIIVCLLSVPLLGEHVGPWRWGAILLGFVGVLVAINPFGADFHWAAPLAILNATGLAIYALLTRHLAGEVSSRTMQFFTGAVGTVLLAPFAIAIWQPSSDPLVLTLWAALGLCAWAGHEFLTRAHRFATASVLMPFSYSFLIYLTIASYIVFDQLPDTATLLGAALIVLSGVIIWQRERRRGRPAGAVT